MQFGGTRGSGTDAELLGNCGGTRGGGTTTDCGIIEQIWRHFQQGYYQGLLRKKWCQSRQVYCHKHTTKV